MMLTKPSGIKRAALAAGAVLCLGGCGFHLEGSGALPPAMAKTYIDTMDRNSEFFTSLRDELRLRGTEIVPSREGADAVLSILTDDAGQRVLSVTAQNVPLEYEVFYAVRFELAAGEQKVIEPESMVATRVYAWDENEVLGKSKEEDILRQALAEDLARRVMRRIEAGGTGASASSTSSSTATPSTPSISSSSPPSTSSTR